MNAKTQKIYNQIDRERQPLNEVQQELLDFLGGELFDKRGKWALTSCNWASSRGVLRPDMYSPPETMTREHILTELNDYWKIAAPVGFKGDDLKALKIAKILLAYYQEKFTPKVWMEKAREVIRSLRGSCQEFTFPNSPPRGSRLVYERYRPGFEKIETPEKDEFVPPNMRRSP